MSIAENIVTLLIASIQANDNNSKLRVIQNNFDDFADTNLVYFCSEQKSLEILKN